MSEFSLYRTLYENSANPYYIELLQRVINDRVYFTGLNFKQPFDKRQNAKKKVFDLLANIYKATHLKKPDATRKRIISGAYYSTNIELSRLGYDVFTPYWVVSRKAPYLKDESLIKLYNRLDRILKKAPLNKLVSKEVFSLIDEYRSAVRSHLLEFSIGAVIFYNDTNFHERVFIDMMKELSRPSFMFTHGGSPIVYNGVDDNRADYLVVWGDDIKEQHIAAGIPEPKIYVSGNPDYNTKNDAPLRNSLENILVLSKTPQGCPTDSTRTILSDKGNAFVYLNGVQKALQQIGVSKARLRVHPSENFDWYRQFIDNDFFTEDDQALFSSLKNASLVIGPTSTVFVEALYSGVNYCVYEPTIDGRDLYDIPIRAPFDGSDQALIPVSKNPEELKKALQQKVCCHSSVLGSYLRFPFDISFMKDLVV